MSKARIDGGLKRWQDYEMEMKKRKESRVVEMESRRE